MVEEVRRNPKIAGDPLPASSTCAPPYAPASCRLIESIETRKNHLE
jgi:hypothetical protein